MGETGPDAMKILIYSENKEVREQVKAGVGQRLDTDLPPIIWEEAATATIAQDKVHNQDYAALVLDGETTKIAGTVLSRTLLAEEPQVPPIVMLVARPQDEWLAEWSGATKVVQRPLNPIALQEALLEIVK